MSEENVHKTCLICGHNHFKKLKKYQHAFLVSCKNCGFVFVERIPNNALLEEHYSNYPRAKEISEITRIRYNELLDHFENYRKTGNLLDIGCGNGLFLEEAKKRGWEVFGIEYVDSVVEFCREKGIKMATGTVCEADFPSKSFDVITSFEVLEHTNKPVDEVKSIHRLLRKEGLFYFTTPNFNSVSRLILGNKWNIIEYPEHLEYFTVKTVNNLLTSNGFVKRKLITTGISLSRFNESRQNKKHESNYSETEDEKVRTMMEKRVVLKFFKKALNKLLTLFSKGDTLKGFYIKK